MKEYKVESFIYYTRVTGGKNHIVDNSTKDIQEKLNEYANNGWTLASTDAMSFGSAVYIYLYFEKDDMLEVKAID